MKQEHQDHSHRRLDSDIYLLDVRGSTEIEKPPGNLESIYNCSQRKSHCQWVWVYASQTRKAAAIRGSIPLKNLDISFLFSEVKFTNLFSSDCGQSGRVKKDVGE